jgi:hypothetical protein
MIKQPKRRIDRPWPVALGDMERHADKWIAVEVEWPAIRDLVEGERAKLLATQTRPKRPLRGKSGGRPRCANSRASSSARSGRGSFSGRETISSLTWRRCKPGR